MIIWGPGFRRRRRSRRCRLLGSEVAKIKILARLLATAANQMTKTTTTTTMNRGAQFEEDAKLGRELVDDYDCKHEQQRRSIFFIVENICQTT